MTEVRALPAPRGPAIIGHGGAGSDRTLSDRVLRGVQAGVPRFREGGALEAAVAGTAALEDDPSFNAGTGSALRTDGVTVQMDAAVMNDRGEFGAVAAIERVQNPVLVARAVLDSPHLLLAGEGATRLARALGMAEYDPTTDEARARHRRLLDALARGRIPETWRRFDLGRAWNYAAALPEELRTCDTVGVVARGAIGGFATTASSGGFGLMLNGRVGDVPVLGSGCYAGRAGAVCATGDGEAIVRAAVSRRVYEWLEAGQRPERSVALGLDLVPSSTSLGILALGTGGGAAGAHASMAWAAVLDGTEVLASA
ncbi:MAG: isoaspartyl peptidase/L-asparaginase [Myxococcota bacterium]